MDAVLRVDLEARISRLVLDHFVNPGGAIALRRLVIDRQVLRDGNLRVLQLQVDRLVFLVVGA